MSERKVSIVINVYNEEENIRDCLDSLAKQSYTDFELIIVDDGSTDDTMDIVKHYSEIFEMKTYHTPHVGIKKARSKGIDETTGDYIIVIDADEILEDDFIEKIIEPLKADKVGAVGGVLKSEGEGWVTIGYAVLNEIFYELRAEDREVDWIQGGCSAYKREALEDVGGLAKEKVSADKDISWKLSKNGWKVLINKNAVAYHRDPQTVKSVMKREYNIGRRERALLSEHKDKVSWKEISRFYPYGFFLFLALSFFLSPFVYIFLAAIFLTMITVGYLISRYTDRSAAKNLLPSWIVLTLINLAWSSGLIVSLFSKD
ncbi:MAG: glycosyltransferase [Candidatus Saliniplasma sp.]